MIIKKFLAKLLIYVVRFYQLVISPLYAPTCRFTPTCSSYAIQALKKHGPFKGLFLTLKRIGSCHPWGREGHDPVP